MAAIEGAGIWVSFIHLVKSLPLWLLTGSSVGLDTFLLVSRLSNNISDETKSWLSLAALILTLSACTLTISKIFSWWQSRKIQANSRKTFYLNPLVEKCYWLTQSDDATLIPIFAVFVVNNRSRTAISLLPARVIKSPVGRKIFKSTISIDGGYQNIPPTETVTVLINIFIERGRKKPGKTLSIALELADSNGYKQKITVPFKCVEFGNSSMPSIYSEPAYTITDPIEKQIVPILQSELNRYSKCGRSVGGLGSIHITYHGRTMTGVGGDMGWNPSWF